MTEKLRRAFALQRSGALRRGIAWQFTYAEWLDVWTRSGKLHLRGRAAGCYVMARHQDEGPYSPGNVKIIKHQENTSEAADLRRGYVRCPAVRESSPWSTPGSTAPQQVAHAWRGPTEHPNRSGAVCLDSPSPNDVTSARHAAGLSQAQAGALIGRTNQEWYRYESGARGMDACLWSLFLLSTDQHPTFEVEAL